MLVRRYERLVFRVVGGFLRKRQDAEDVAQEVFLRAYEGLAGFRVASPFGPWIAQIAVRTTYDRLRQSRHVREVSWEHLSPEERAVVRDLTAGGNAADRLAVRDLLDRALSHLAPKDRLVLILAEGLGFSGAEVSEILGCSSLAARLRLHRGRRALRKVIEKLMVGMPPGR